MPFPSRSSIARRPRPRQVIWATSLLVSGTALTPGAHARPPAACPSGSVIPQAQPDVQPRADDPLPEAWNVLVGLVRAMCVLVGCPGTESRDVLPGVNPVRESAIAMAESQIDSYFASGLDPDLTPGEISQGLLDTSALLSFLSSHPAMLPGSLHARYSSALREIQHDLQQ